jgi:predicted HicB family RNase H-like nuclease
MMEYKGYLGKVEYDDEAGIFHGEVISLRSAITFQGETVQELRQAFQKSVDDYLAFCAERHEEPERPYSGTFTVRVPSELHRDAVLQARLINKSLNSWVAELLAEAAAHTNAQAESAKAFQSAATPVHVAETRAEYAVTPAKVHAALPVIVEQIAIAVRQMTRADQQYLLDLVPDLRQLTHQPPVRTVAEASNTVAAFKAEVLAALDGRPLSSDEPFLNGLTLGQYDALPDDEKTSLWDRLAQVNLMEMDENEVSPNALSAR